MEFNKERYVKCIFENLCMHVHTHTQHLWITDIALNPASPPIMWKFSSSFYITTTVQRHTPPLNPSTGTPSTSSGLQKLERCITMPWIWEIHKKSAVDGFLTEWKGLVQPSAALHPGQALPASLAVICMSTNGHVWGISCLPWNAAAEVSARPALGACLLSPSASFFFLENKREREAVRVGGCWLRESDGRKQQRPYTSAETLPEMLGTHCCHLPLRVWVCCKQQPSPNMSVVGLRWVENSSHSAKLQQFNPEESSVFTHTHTSHVLCQLI